MCQLPGRGALSESESIKKKKVTEIQKEEAVSGKRGSCFLPREVSRKDLERQEQQMEKEE